MQTMARWSLLGAAFLMLSACGADQKEVEAPASPTPTTEEASDTGDEEIDASDDVTDEIGEALTAAHHDDSEGKGDDTENGDEDY